MSEKEYIVGLNKGVDYDQFNQDMIASTGSGDIPNRSVDVAKARPASQRLTHYSLTDEEANALRNDSRVACVELPVPLDMTPGVHASQAGNFAKTTSSTGNNLNWGLMRSNQDYNNYSTGSSPFETNFDYVLDGEGVDIVIQDSGVEPTHPEWHDADGNSRYRSIDWYATARPIDGNSIAQSTNHDRDFDGHGTHCAGIAAGRTFGWAKGAHIYSQKLFDLAGPNDSGTGILISDAFDLIKIWHQRKNDPSDPIYTGRPTVVNMSWGYSSTILERDFDVNVYPTQPNGTYRGGTWQYGVDVNSRQNLLDTRGFFRSLYISSYYTGVYGSPAGNFVKVPARQPTVDIDVDEMIDAGIHVVIAAGNTPFKADVPGGPDYDNTISFSGTTAYGVPINNRHYHRGSSPYSERAFLVGNIDSTPENSAEDRFNRSSTRGPAINISAPGTDIKSSCSNTNTKGAQQYYLNPLFRQVNISGTSMAAPQVTGVAACMLQLQKDLTPDQLLDQITRQASPTMVQLGTDTDYDCWTTRRHVGTPNRVLRQKFNAAEDGKMLNGISLANCVVKQA